MSWSGHTMVLCCDRPIVWVVQRTDNATLAYQQLLTFKQCRLSVHIRFLYCMLRSYGIIILSDHYSLSLHVTIPKRMSADHSTAMVCTKSELPGNEAFDTN